jgi:succinyl-diaminopimelate desuccinylase
LNGLSSATGATGAVGSIVSLAGELVRTPSRGGIDDHGPVLDVLERWLARRELPHRRLADPQDGTTAGLLVEIAGGRPGRWWTLDACVDTAPFGDRAAWSFPPTAGDVVDGWLRGRGAADSKTAAAMFCHLAADVAPRAAELSGGLAVLLDADEHTGRFGGARAYLADPRAARPAGVLIGYPGIDEVVVGGRGLWRCVLTVHASSGHSGARREVVGAVSRAARLVRMLDEAELPREDSFPLPPRLTVTAIGGGEGFSVVPDRCSLNVDVRTTPGFGPPRAERLVRGVVAAFDEATTAEAGTPGPRPTEVEPVAAWPAYRLDGAAQPAAALLGAAADAGLEVRAKVAGPSNIGNLLAGEGVPATAGFGLPYQGLHGTDERVHLAELPIVHAVYRQAVLRLLGAG